MLHLLALHQHGSNNPLGIDRRGPQDAITFHPYYTIKDLFGLCVFLLIFAVFIFYMPNALGHPDNNIPANPMVTPNHIVPEWYFLPYYAILRAVPNKLLGVILMFSSVLILLLLPWLDTSRVRSARYRPIYRLVSWLLPIDAVILGYVGSQPPAGFIVTLGQLATIYYFFHFLILIPLLGKIERPLPLPLSIAEAVLGPRTRPATAGEGE
jgi:ubiquinol-cytochrome c reductase cytochrome b/c1 subunit